MSPADRLDALRAARAVLVEFTAACKFAAYTPALGRQHPDPTLPAQLLAGLDAEIASVERRARPMAVGMDVEVVKTKGSDPWELVTAGPVWLTVRRFSWDEKYRRDTGRTAGGYSTPYIHPDDLARINRGPPGEEGCVMPADTVNEEFIDPATEAWWWLSRCGGHDIDGEWEASEPPSVSGPLTGTGLHLRVYGKRHKGRARYTRWSATFLDSHSSGGVSSSIADARRKAEAWWRAHRAAVFVTRVRGWRRLFRWDSPAQRWVEVGAVAGAWECLSDGLRTGVEGGVYAEVYPDGTEHYYELGYQCLSGAHAHSRGGGPMRTVNDWRRGTYRVLIPPVRSQHDVTGRD